LPNITNKIVAGVIDGNDLVGLFSIPEISQDGQRVTIYNKSEHKAHFLSIVPSQSNRSGPQSGARIQEEITLQQPNQTKPEASGDSKAEQHFSYVLQSTLVQKKEEKSKVERSKLEWSDGQNSDVADISRLK